MNGNFYYSRFISLHNKYNPRYNGILYCSFTEFFPFCIKLYYFSNFKDFNTYTPA